MHATYSLRNEKIWNAAFEINVVDHCNLACRSCSHLSPIMARSAIDAEELYNDLSLLSGSYHADTAKLLGGEPLLHPELAAIAEAVRRAGVADRVQVVTNGVLLPRMGHEFWAAVDEVSVSVYPGYEPSGEVLSDLRGHAKEHGVQLRMRTFPRFRESFATKAAEDKTLVKGIYDTCKIAHDWRCHTVADGYFYKCPKAYFITKVLDRGDVAATTSNGVKITSDPSFRETLREYLESREPLEACSRCLGTVGRRFEHQQVGRTEWLPFQDRPLEDLIDLQLLANDERRMRLPWAVRKVAERLAGVV